ncbi:MAG: L-2-amino-thiazoline-4-carboxylic acid hydrolase [Bacteroidetes bacterium]|nr:L-2-amino-thiazoline-4-carboxylic acid hydrolase [Bacteroidota bacterium]MCL5024995.1 L-2-amino-thiazoline-4-carboxylic acid hydrolase [Chloroflexota bacterium]
MTIDAEGEVRRMARLQALLYYLFAREIIEKYGEEGRDLVRKVVWEFGRVRGEKVREQVEAQGLPTTPDNYGKVPDLPSIGWERETLRSDAEQHRTRITYCPFAEMWRELGPQAEELGIVFCEVDEAKYRAFNPDLCFARPESMLCGGTCCDMIVSAPEEQT